jgi:bifunctional non-homologous end joining protein LigD
MEYTTLYYRHGASDKVYQAGLEARDGGYVVHFAYGRRGATLATGSKTQAPVAYAAAKAIYDKLVAEKTAKGYTPGPDGTPYHHTGEARRATGIHCQLLNPVEDDQVERLIADPAWLAQPKHDGRRLLIDKRGDGITGINRLGLTVALPETLAHDAGRCPLDLILDGECIGETFHAFDALRIENDDIGGLPYSERYLRLMNLLASFQHPHIQFVRTAFTLKQKTELFGQLQKADAEGIVFKRIDAPYLAGRPASGGPQLKHKFCATASLIVGKINAKRSVSLLLFEGDKVKPAGNVTIPPNYKVPLTGQIVECRYLYAFPESGCIFQPVYLGPRDDITAAECLTAQLKYKANAAEEAA